MRDDEHEAFDLNPSGAPPAWLPHGFTWGVATSSLHSEGAGPAADWAGWEADGHAPPSGDGNGFAVHHREDFRLLDEVGFGAVRLTLEWARLEPKRTDRLDPDQVERYRDILGAAHTAGLDVWVGLAHGTFPGWFSEDERGFLDERMARRVWPAHVDRVAEAFGDLVDGWFTIHEPVRYALDAWLNARRPPGRRSIDDAGTGLRALQRADAQAAGLLRSGQAPVASSEWLPPIYALEPSPAGRRAAAEAEDLLWRSWADPDRLEAWDLVGVSCSHAVAVAPDGSFHPWPRGAEPGPLGWAPWAPALGETLHRVADELPDRELVVAATGAVDIDEGRRADTTRGLVSELREAVEDGVTVRGCFWWSAVDGYEEPVGFTARSGMLDRDRTPTAAARSLWA